MQGSVGKPEKIKEVMTSADWPSRPMTLTRGGRILLVDDLIATGGTAAAAARLVRRLNGEVVGAAFIIDLPELGGTAALRKDGINVHTLVAFEGH